MQYTYKDYEAIFDYLTEKATELSNGQWTDFSDGDFGTIVIHLLSYWGDLLSNQLDLTASELFISTAEERTSLMEIVKLVGYEPSHFQSSVAYVELTYIRQPNVQYEPYSLPAYTKFLTTDGTLSYYNLDAITLTDNINTLTLYEGIRSNKTFYYDDIDEYGRISLNDYYAATNTVSCTMMNGSTAGELSRVTDVRFTTGEMCFSVHVDLDGIPYIQFPSNWASYISDPTTFNVIYLTTNGVEGRTGANTITRCNVTTVSNNYTITNPEASVGGYNPETVAEIKTKASVFARTMYSLVTLKDFEDVAVFVDDIVQVKALDYNNDESEFPPTIPAYVQPSPPNGVPNDAYKVLIMAVPSNLSDQTMFTIDDKNTYSKLTAAAQQLHNIYMERKSATLYIEYRDPIYIEPWLILNIYLDPNDLTIASVAEEVVDFLKTRYSRNRVAIGESLYGSVIGKDILNAFPNIDYVEVRDPEYNIEAAPYEYIDLNNGYYQIFVNDSLYYVPTGMQLVKLKRGNTIRLLDASEEGREIKTIEYCSSDIYDGNPSYVPNSYVYHFDKSTGEYPRLDLEKVGVLYDDNGATMVLAVPDDMLNLGEEQTFILTPNKNYLHIYNPSTTSSIDDLITYSEEGTYAIPSYVTVEYDEAKNMSVTFTTSYAGVFVKQYTVQFNQILYITKANGDIWQWDYSNSVDPYDLDKAVHFERNGGDCLFYVPEDWEVSIA